MSQALVDSCAAELKAAEVGKRDWETPLHQAQHAVEVWIGLDHKEPYPFPVSPDESSAVPLMFS